MALAVFHFKSLVQVLPRRLCDVDSSNSEGKVFKAFQTFIFVDGDGNW